jgi:DNA replication protein DnaC
LTSDDDGAAVRPTIRPTKFSVDYGDKVVEMNTKRNTKKTTIQDFGGNHGAYEPSHLPGYLMDREFSSQPIKMTKKSLKEQLLAAQREEKLLDAQLKAQTTQHGRYDVSKKASPRNIHQISFDENEEYILKNVRTAPRQNDKTANGSAFDFAPAQEPALPFDMSPLSYNTLTQSAVKQERQGPPKPNVTKAKDAKIEPELCEEQRRLVSLILGGQNVFYTGSAGCGKSTVLKAFVKELKARGRKVVIVAPTGKAALEVNGCTFWTFAGWTPSHFKKPLKKLQEGAHGKFVRKKMNDVDVLVIDEISMMENHAFERLNEVMKVARGKSDAFGGVQLVVTGDFCQLPPVKPFSTCMECGRETSQPQRETVYKCPQHGNFLDIDKWAFRSLAWRQAEFQHVNLTTIHRQRDRKFIDILEKCRMGRKLTEKDSHLLLNHKTNVANAVRLFPTRNEVRMINTTEFNKIPHQKRIFKCFDHFSQRENHPHLNWKHTRDHDGSLTALKEHKFESQIELKESMLVVLQVNISIEEGLVNGSQGVIVGWETYDPSKMPTHVDRDSKAPQPMLPILGDHAILREENIKHFMEQAAVKEWPIVNFDNGVQRTIFADCVVNEMGDEQPYSIISRTQIPLIAGWVSVLFPYSILMS